ncbi:MAG: hypothetical protein ABUS57_04860 [Pseudomonadota bacterium]
MRDLVWNMFWSLQWITRETAILWGWPAVAVAILTFALWPKTTDLRRKLWWFAILFVPWITAALLAGAFWAKEPYNPFNPPNIGWIMLAPLLAELALVILLLVRLRGMRFLAGVHGLLHFFITLCFTFVGDMAVTGSWM